VLSCPVSSTQNYLASFGFFGLREEVKQFHQTKEREVILPYCKYWRTVSIGDSSTQAPKDVTTPCPSLDMPIDSNFSSSASLSSDSGK
jgi:hypothetical protein